MTHPQTKITTHAQDERRLGLDGLRFIAAMAVVLFHFAFRMAVVDEGSSAAYPEISGLAAYGFLGVNAFFIISGYVITWSAQARNPFDFLVARIARLWPAYVFCMTITFVVMLFWGAPTYTPSLFQWIANLTMVSPALGQDFMDGAYWSIFMELIFYFWVFVLLLFGVFQKRLIEIVIVWLGISILNQTVLHLGPLEYLFITEYAGFFIIGMLLFANEQNPAKETKLLILVASLWSIATTLQGSDYMREHYGFEGAPITMILASTFAILLTIACLRAKKLPFSRGFIITLGGITYPLYLLHQHIGYVIYANFPQADRWALLGGIIALVLVASFIVYKGIEPLGRKLIFAIWKALRPKLPFINGAIVTKA